MTYVDNERRPVLVGVDGSQSALHAVNWAAHEAQNRRAPLRLIHVCSLVPVRHPRHVAPPPEYENAVLAQGRHWLNDAARRACTAVPGLAVGTDLRDGVTADVLVGESAGAELVVLGSQLPRAGQAGAHGAGRAAEGQPDARGRDRRDGRVAAAAHLRARDEVVFHTAPVGVQAWLSEVGAGFIPFALVELEKVAWRR